jgi:hypothetical protein
LVCTEVDGWQGRNLLFDLLAYGVDVAPYIGKPDDCFIISHTENQTAAALVGESTDGLQPAFRLLDFECFFEVAVS